MWRASKGDPHEAFRPWDPSRPLGFPAAERDDLVRFGVGRFLLKDPRGGQAEMDP